ncbi:TlpA disulfide reductase family protein [uncultured Pontibacter sp.]|uniref:TlpA disulfide reductase family protein n=1 Tax=uncultured Pontibacter sp. TaxID=453356 RepID=UPI00263817E4|nr:TlpA disulfide reductase family protein [uncultured Pontibacter sp.]
MKRMLILLLACMLATHSLLAQGTVTITGKVQKGQEDDIFIASLPSLLFPEEQRTFAEINNGRFRLELPVSKPLTVELVYGNESAPLYLEPGFELQVTFSAGKMLKTLKYSGQGANENNYLTLHAYRFDEEEDYQTLPDNVKLSEKEFLQFLDYRREDQLAIFEKRIAAKPVSEYFRQLILAEIDYSYANDRLTFFNMRELMRLPVQLTPSTGYFDFLQQLDMEQLASLEAISFPAFLRNYIKFIGEQAQLDAGDIHYYKKTYEQVSHTLQGQAKVMAQAYLIRQSLQQGNVLHVPAMLQDFRQHKAVADVYATLLQQYESHPGLGIGSAAPDFSLRDINGQLVSLSDFKGKIVYLSFWRTDCGLCMVEQPHAQELARKLQPHDVVLINIGVDEQEQSWRSVVQSRGLGGVQLYLKGQGHELARQYGLKDVPAYFLIDEDGTILSTKPRRPIDREAEKEILQHVMNNRASRR